jgi:membrane-associated protein
VADSLFGVGSRISYPGLLIGAPICAIAGAQLGHFLGAKYGRRLFSRPDSRFFKLEYVAKAEYYFTKFGPAKAVVLARFIPIVRTFLNPVAGVLGMPARTFLLWNVVGGVLWTDGIILAGYALAKKIRDVIPDGQVDKYILPAVAVIVFISILPILIEVYRERRNKRRQARARAALDAEAASRATPTRTQADAGLPARPAGPTPESRRGLPRRRLNRTAG